MNRYIITASADRTEYGMTGWFDFDAALSTSLYDRQAFLKTHDVDGGVLEVVKEFYAADWDAAHVVYEEVMKQRC